LLERIGFTTNCHQSKSRYNLKQIGKIDLAKARKREEERRETRGREEENKKDRDE
jgi:hypothetical protein